MTKNIKENIQVALFLLLIGVVFFLVGRYTFPQEINITSELKTSRLSGSHWELWVCKEGTATFMKIYDNMGYPPIGSLNGGCELYQLNQVRLQIVEVYDDANVGWKIPNY